MIGVENPHTVRDQDCRRRARDSQAGHGVASGSVNIWSDPDPPDEPPGPLRGPGERELDSARLLFRLHFVAQPLDFLKVLFESQQQVVLWDRQS
jgi:hypothetical protein